MITPDIREEAGRQVLIHPSADVSDDARIGENTQIWDHARVREGAVIGDDCIVGRGAFIDVDVHIGDRVKVQNNALVYHGTSVESGVFIGPGAILTNDRFPRSITVDGGLAGPQDWVISEIHLAEGCSVGAGAVVVAGCDVGPFALVGAGAVVTRSVPAHGLVVGNPARLIGWVCACGQRLIGAEGQTMGADDAGQATCPRDGKPFAIHDGSCRPEVSVP